MILTMAEADIRTCCRGKPATYLMANGVSARLPVADPLGQNAYVAVAHVGGHTQRGPRNDSVFLAAPISAVAILTHLAHQVRTCYAACLCRWIALTPLVSLLLYPMPCTLLCSAQQCRGVPIMLGDCWKNGQDMLHRPQQIHVDSAVAGRWNGRIGPIGMQAARLLSVESVSSWDRSCYRTSQHLPAVKRL